MSRAASAARTNAALVGVGAGLNEAADGTGTFVGGAGDGVAERTAAGLTDTGFEAGSVSEARETDAMLSACLPTVAAGVCFFTTGGGSGTTGATG